MKSALENCVNVSMFEWIKEKEQFDFRAYTQREREGVEREVGITTIKSQ